MNRMGIKSKYSKKYMTTTDSNHNYPVAENILNREFTQLKDFYILQVLLIFLTGRFSDGQ